MHPLVTICIPSFNREVYLKQAIESALSQDYENIEVIVADNCSSDNTALMVEQFLGDVKFRFYSNTENIGMVRNWKKLLEEEIKGEWFLILSDDDYLIDKSFVSKAVEIIESDTNVKMVYSSGVIDHVNLGETVFLNLPFDEISSGEDVFLQAHNVKPQAFTLCGVIFNTSVAREIDSFSNVENFCCDYELFSYSCLRGSVGVVHDPASVYRFHGDNIVTRGRTIEQMEAILVDSFVKPQMKAEKENGISSLLLKKRFVTHVAPFIKQTLKNSARMGYLDFIRVYRVLKSNGVKPQSLFLDPVFSLKVLLALKGKILLVIKKLV